MGEDAEIRGVIPTYYSFLVEKLNRIYEAWDKNDYYSALLRAIRLVNFLPVKIKKKLADEKARIQKRLVEAQTLRGHTYDSTQTIMQARVKQISLSELPAFVDFLTTLLDEERLLTIKYGVPTTARNMGTIQRTVDIAKQQMED